LCRAIKLHWCTAALALVLASPDRVFAGFIALSIADGRTWHDTNFDGSFSDGVSAPGAVSYIAFANRGLNAVRAGIAFDLRSLSDYSIVRADLLLVFHIAQDFNNGPNPTDPVFGPPTMNLHGTGGNGQISSTDVEFANLLSTFSPLTGATSQLDVTSFIRALAANGTSFAEISIRVSGDRDPNTHAQGWFHSEFANQAYHPILLLEVTPVPAPSGIVLFGTGIMCLMAVRCRQIGCRFGITASCP